MTQAGVSEYLNPGHDHDANFFVFIARTGVFFIFHAVLVQRNGKESSPGVKIIPFLPYRDLDLHIRHCFYHGSCQDLAWTNLETIPPFSEIAWLFFELCFPQRKAESFPIGSHEQQT